MLDAGSPLGPNGELRVANRAEEIDAGSLAGDNTVAKPDRACDGAVVVDIVVADIIEAVSMGGSRAGGSLTIRTAGGTPVADGRGPLTGVG